MYLNSAGKMLKFMLDNDGCTSIEIAGGAGVAQNAVQYMLQALEVARDAKGVIYQNGQRGRGSATWTLVPEAKQRVRSWFVFLEEIARGEHPPTTVKP
jgi:hypothetical protein